MTRKLKLFFIFLTICIVLISCSKFQKPGLSEDFLMGTVIMQKVYGKNADQAIKAVNKKIADIERLMTINAPGGDVNKINEFAGRELVKVDKDTLYVLKKAWEFSNLSRGTFDVTVGKVVKMWGIFTDNPRVPNVSEIIDALGFINYNDIIIDESKSMVGLKTNGQVIDLGAIAKGFAGDEAIRLYKEYGIKSAFVNLGGNVVVLGNKPDGSPWRIGIQNPQTQQNDYIGIINVSDKAVVTSGDYERYFEKEGKRYHHIIDPKTGYPSDSDLMSSTIVTELSVDADALSTATFVMGLDKALAFVESLDNVEGIFITKENKIYVTHGLKDNFVFEDESKVFEYVEKR